MTTSKDTMAAYNEIYQSSGIVRRASYFLWLFDLVDIRPGQLLVDASCGQGQLVDFAQKKGIRAIGFDVSFQAVKRGLELNKNAGWFVSDGEICSLPDGCADLVMNIGSLEHYQNVDYGIKELARIVKRDGTVLILLPNTFALFGNIKYAIKHGDAFDDGQPLQRYNTNLGWKKIIERNGLKVIKTVKYEVSPPKTWKDFGWMVRRPKKLMRYFLSILIPLNLANAFVYLCKCKDAV